MRRALALSLAALAVAALCAAGILALFGRGGALDRRPLLAEVTLAPMLLPQGYGIDPVLVTDELVARLQERVDTDLALRMLMGTEETMVLREQAIPRILNAGVMRRLLEEVEGLGAVIDLAAMRGVAEVAVTNRGPAALSAVALTLPGAARAEGVDGPAPALRDHGGGLASLTWEGLGPGATLRARVWTTLAPAEIDPAAVRVGAGGLDGRVAVYASQTGWNGADLQVMPWARWLVAGVLAAVAAAALAAGGVALAQAAREGRARRA